MENPEFLKGKYWDKEEFRDAVGSTKEEGKTARREGKSTAEVAQPQDIPDYLERIKHIAEIKGSLFLKKSLYPKLVVKPDNITDDYLKNLLLGNFAEQRGYERDQIKGKEVRTQVIKQFQQETGQGFAGYQIPEKERREIVQQAVIDQKESLNCWFDYLSSPEAEHYPDEFRYWAFAEATKLGTLDRQRKDFSKRTEKTAAPFPELNQQALAIVLDELERKHKDQKSGMELEDAITKKDWQKRLQVENFGKLYGWAVEHVNSLTYSQESLQTTSGTWKVFPQGSNPKKLSDLINSYNTNWCIATPGTAGSYLSRSDVHIYFSDDKQGKPSIPRAAIITDGQKISEVRGIINTKSKKQHLDSHITPVVEEHLQSMSGGEKWQQRMKDMKKLASIDLKQLKREKLSKEELRFLYEVDNKITAVGYGRDPRIEQLREQRNPKEDVPTIFDCHSDQIAWDTSEIKEDTKAYIGQLESGIFHRLYDNNVNHVYSKFPENRILLEKIKIGTVPKEDFEQNLKSQDQNIRVGRLGKELLNKPDFTTADQPKDIKLVALWPADLGLEDEYPKCFDIYQNAAELGLDKCPAEVGPQLLLHEETRKQVKEDEGFIVAMRPMYDDRGSSYSFHASRWGEELLFDGQLAEPDRSWDHRYRVVFQLGDTRPNSEKREMFQMISSTGLSSDYVNETAPLKLLLKTQGPEVTMQAIRERGIRTYTERFPAQVYRDVVNDRNRERIILLEVRVDNLKATADLGRADRQLLEKQLNEIESILNGTDRI
ncbi:MAG: hypothetical protein A3B76_03240 [Candidatus Andersenbacteria bacterium RIFCSPHIGHO2_02_FULL_46_16]|nr:MAG: hypothetical protein A3B76_03240 [Candidatus Andersenbacteria bacterium RIFCSPHIGHO2_02_FULL_46_16]